MVQLFERLKQSLNQRTLYALIILGCLLGFALIARIGDAVASAELSHRQAQERLARHGGGVDEEVWLTRAENAEAALAEWQATQWAGRTPGIAAAELQRALTRIALSAQLRVISITVEPAPVEIPEGLVLRFRMATDSRSGDSVAKVLAAFSSHRPLIFVDGVNAVFDERGSGRFSLDGYAPITVAAPAQENS